VATPRQTERRNYIRVRQLQPKPKPTANTQHKTTTPFPFWLPEKKKVGRAEREKTKENDARQKKYTRTHDALPPTGTPSVVRFSLSHFSFFSLFLKRDIKKKYRDET